jgi:S1-C subfamily serine protease
MKRHFLVMMAGVLVAVVASSCGRCVTPVAERESGPDTAKAGREVLATSTGAVVTVKLALKQSMSFGGRDSKTEMKTETTGTVIDPSGLTVVSLMTTDPGSAMKDVYARAMSARGGDASQLKFDSELSDVKIVLPDGTEIPAEVVLRDKDLDLAYLRPSEKPAEPLAFIDLKRDGKAQILDEVIVVNRLSQAANRATAVSIGRIEAIIEKPRTFYLLGQAMWGYALGAPVFSVDGKLLGLLFLRAAKAQTDQSTGFMFNNLNTMGMMPVILPAADIVDGAKQALEAKSPVPEEKPATDEETPAMEEEKPPTEEEKPSDTP